MNIIAMDAHKHYSQICIHDEGGRMVCERRIEHARGAIRRFLAGYPAGSPVAGKHKSSFIAGEKLSSNS